MDCSPPAPLFMEISRQEHWSGLPFPTPGTEPVFLALADEFFTRGITWGTWETVLDRFIILFTQIIHFKK